ncbi:MAG: RHS repeat protein, partial [Candidatus Accumulibacter sp.]|nr:RHS repeat protein [Candidatus Accumulibacter necessarius]
DAVSGRILQQRVFDASGTLRAKMVWTYNARNQLATVSRIDPVTLATRTVTYTYCESADVTAGTCPTVGLLTAVDGPRTDVQDVVTYTYRMADEATCATAPTTCPWRKGDLWKTTNKLNQVVEIASRDGAGRPKSIIDATGVTTDLEYNVRGWATARKVRGTNGASESDDRITRFWYYPFGAIKRVLQADGMDATFNYDQAERLTEVGDNRGNWIRYTLNAAGDRTGENVVDTSGTIRQTLSRTYDTLGRLQSQVDAYNHATTFEYDAEGLPTRTTDALQRKTDTTNDPLGRTTLTVADVGGIAAQTHVQYDALDRVARVTDPKGLDTVYTYNGFDDLVQLESPDTGIATSDYDAAGNRTSATDARQVTVTTQYDVLNRPTSRDYPGTAEDVAYDYDTPTADCATGETFLTGRLAKMSDGSGSTSYCYNRFGDLVRKVQRTNGQALTLQWSVLANGRLASMTYPDGTVVDFVRDYQGRNTGLGVTPLGGARQTLLSSATYHPFGPVAQWTWGNARTMTRTLNLNGQPGIVQDTAPGGLSLGYQFDEVGNLKWLRDGYHNDPPLRVYDYDALNRLTSAEDGATNAVLQAYTYDATGNRTSRTQGTPQAYTYGTTDHKLQGVAGIARGYDAMGNTTSIGGTAKEFVYNQAGRMSGVKAGGVQTASYGYNGRGERVSKAAGSQTVLTLYAPNGRWMGDYDAAGQPLQQVVWLGDLPVGLLTGAGTGQKLHYVEPDALGSPRVVIDPVRDVAVWRWDLTGEAFGDSAPVQDPDGDGIAFVFDMRFPGQRYDSATGMNYNYFRDYDPATGRYVESDPIGLKGGVSTFGYAGGNSLTSIDVFGLAKGRLDGWYVLGVHTWVTAERNLNDGHAWISLVPYGGTDRHTYGAWPDGRRPERGGDQIPDNGDGWDIREDMEHSHGYPDDTQRAYFLISPEQYSLLLRYLKKNYEFGSYSNNCAKFARDALAHATGISVSTADISSFWVDTPSQLSRRLDALADYADTDVGDGIKALSPRAQVNVINILRSP